MFESVFLPIITLSKKIFMSCANHFVAWNAAITSSILILCKIKFVNSQLCLVVIIVKIPYLPDPGNNENLKKLLPIKWKREENRKLQLKSNNALINAWWYSNYIITKYLRSHSNKIIKFHIKSVGSSHNYFSHCNRFHSTSYTCHY